MWSSFQLCLLMCSIVKSDPPLQSYTDQHIWITRFKLPLNTSLSRLTHIKLAPAIIRHADDILRVSLWKVKLDGFDKTLQSLQLNLLPLVSPCVCVCVCFVRCLVAYRFLSTPDELNHHTVTTSVRHTHTFTTDLRVLRNQCFGNPSITEYV